MDDSVGEIVAALESKGIMEDTVIIFMSDNGGNFPMNSNIFAEKSVFCFHQNMNSTSWPVEFMENPGFPYLYDPQVQFMTQTPIPTEPLTSL